MPHDPKSPPEARRLEELWAGSFGDEYTTRNEAAGASRGAFWKHLLAAHPVRAVLEVGCNVGLNLDWIRHLMPPAGVYGVDVNEGALRALRQRLPEVNAVWSQGRALPFRDRWFDLSFTSGVLIHQPEATLPLVMQEVVRVSRRYVLEMEYHAEETTEVPYRGQSGALFKRDYRRLYLDLFPELEVVDEGFLSRTEGWDDVTWTLFART